MRQTTTTVLAKVHDQAALAKALAVLAKDRAPLSARPALPPQPRLFADPSLAIHFARLVLLPKAEQGAAWLALETNFDTELPDGRAAQNDHLARLAEAHHRELLSAFSCCEGIDAGASADELARYLVDHRVEPTVTYQGHADRPLARIRLEQRVRDAVLELLSTVHPAPPRHELFSRVRAHMKQLEATDPAFAELGLAGPAPASPDPRVRKEKLHAGIRPWLTNLVPYVGRAIVDELRVHFSWDRTDSYYDRRARQEAWTEKQHDLFRDIAASEDHGLQNALTHLVPLRPGAPARLQVLKDVHAYIDRMSNAHFKDVGQLGGIPTIHFAKWVLIDEGKRLLFLSNYDSSWESYLGDFIDDAALGLNLAWACTEDYPRTRCLFRDGAHDEESFKAWGRMCQLPTPVFFSAYADLGIAAINNNSLIRHALHHEPREVDLEAWFRRLS